MVTNEDLTTTLQGIHDKQHTERGDCEANKKVFGVSPGARKYARVYVQYSGLQGKSAFCFVDLTNGNVLKPASWKAPAPHARGNIYTDHGCGEFGPRYLR